MRRTPAAQQLTPGGASFTKATRDTARTVVVMDFELSARLKTSGPAMRRASGVRGLDGPREESPGASGQG